MKSPKGKKKPAIALKWRGQRGRVEAIRYEGIRAAGLSFQLPDKGLPQWLNDAYLADQVCSYERAVHRGAVPADVAEVVLNMPATLRAQLGWAGETISPGQWLVRGEDGALSVAESDFPATHEAIE